MYSSSLLGYQALWPSWQAVEGWVSKVLSLSPSSPHPRSARCNSLAWSSIVWFVYLSACTALRLASKSLQLLCILVRVPCLFLSGSLGSSECARLFRMLVCCVTRTTPQASPQHPSWTGCWLSTLLSVHRCDVFSDWRTHEGHSLSPLHPSSHPFTLSHTLTHTPPAMADIVDRAEVEAVFKKLRSRPDNKVTEPHNKQLN